ncbi:probable Dolichyl pyrophosphate Glc1Man9GlcNAc2 alpha-1,3-glucosyltransferase [Zygosaccharomyces bailii]|nr:probable Dolichyl pyrophosphate Glc1Man9GlcNAc2 alpha-1,3-glucosyltransferase [Zygosaccharomyces bailii]
MVAMKGANIHEKPKASKVDGPLSMGNRRFSLWNFWISSLLLKILLIPDYFSTDFDVHRNWLAITHRLPLCRWYHEHTSQWTLDYPPFFAYFEWFLSQFVPSIVEKDGCLDIVEKGHFGWPTIVFQRSTVIISEILLFVVLQVFINTSSVKEKTQSFVTASSIVLSPGFLIVDHIHFQYNGFLFAILIASIVAAKQKRYLWCAFFYSVALCFKHIFLYLAPCYFVFLLKAYCLNFSDFKFRSYKDLIFIVRWKHLFELGFIVITVFTLCFGPFVHDMPQLMNRLFPFSRGLTHAYWAPNFWALYSFLDKVFTVIMLKLPYVHKFASKFISPPLIPATIEEIRQRVVQNNGTKGLVQDVYFVILPQITPKLTFTLTGFYQILAVIPLMFDASYKRFIGSLTLCGLASYLFGWHVHEKAIMLAIVPFSFLVVCDRRLLTSFMLLTASGYVSLFPLLYQNQDFLLKCLYTIVWCVIYFYALRKTTVLSSSVERRVFFLDRLSMIYIYLLLPLVFGFQFLDLMKWRYPLFQKFEFLGLMSYSVYCSLGIMGSWIGLSWLYNFDEPLWE